jgi:hypothetical protein
MPSAPLKNSTNQQGLVAFEVARKKKIPQPLYSFFQD